MEAAKAGGRGWGVTEEEWLKWKSPHLLIECYCIRAGLKRGPIKRSDPLHRRARLFGCGCCSYSIRLDRRRELVKSVEVAERFADRLTTAKTLRAELEALQRMPPNQKKFDILSAIIRLLLKPEFRIGAVVPPGARRRKHFASIFRDIFGNPFRPVAFDPRWRTSDVVGVARAIYDDKAFERMPILADALMDAGCEDEQVISHCRGDGPHVRGCWVVDLVLEKE
jgi:hypothetical protein